MAAVYILYSLSANKFYIGSTKDFELRLSYHHTKEFSNSFTAKFQDWELYFLMDNMENYLARKIESHIKKMKSRKYIEDLKKYPEISQRLVEKFSH